MIDFGYNNFIARERSKKLKSGGNYVIINFSLIIITDYSNFRNYSRAR